VGEVPSADPTRRRAQAPAVGGTWRRPTTSRHGDDHARRRCRARRALGAGPRAWALAFTLWSVGFGGDLGRVDRVAAGYGRHVSLEPEELDALHALVRARPVVFLAWAAATGRRPAAAAVAELDAVGSMAAAIGARVRAVLR
jgi:hypothetical protein